MILDGVRENSLSGNPVDCIGSYSQLYLRPLSIDSKYFIRFAVCWSYTSIDHTVMLDDMDVSSMYCTYRGLLYF